MFVNSSVGWLGISASPFCSFYSSYLQQKLPSAKVSTLIPQSNAMRTLKKLSTVIFYPRPSHGQHKVSVVLFPDASRFTDHGQFALIAGILIGRLQGGSVYHVFNRLSHKSKRPVRSIGAAEIFAASDAVEERRVFKRTLYSLLKINDQLIVVVDAQDLFTLFSTQRNSFDRPIRADVNMIRFEYQTGNVDEII